MSNSVHVNVSGTWKTASNYYVNVGGTWKTGSAIGPNVSSAWKGFTTVYTGNILTTNLKLHLNGNHVDSYKGSGTSWTDLTSNNNNGAITGADFIYSNPIGGAFDLDGTDDDIAIPDDASIEPSNSDWTFEAWINVDSGASGYNCIFSKNATMQVYWHDNQIKVWANDTDATSGYDLDDLNTGSNTLAKDGWHHIVVSRASNVWKIYIDKVEKASTTVSFTVGDTSDSAEIGNYHGDNYFFNGKIAQVRMYKGTGLTATQVANNYDATVGIDNIKLYLDGNYNDSYSGSGSTWYDLTSGITAKSVDFDGTNDYLTTTAAYINMNDSFCVEAWVNWDSTGTSSDMGMICSQYAASQSGRMLFGSQSDNCVVRTDGGGVRMETGDNSITTGTWYHVAWTWDGTTHRLFLDGVLKDTATSTIPSIYTGTNTEIGGQSTLGSGSYWIDGKISNFRIVQGDAVYTSAFSPTTQPLTNITGTALLCCQSDSSVTAATVSSGTITATGSPSVSTDHPFGNNGTISGATWDSTNKWFEFDGSDDSITFTNDSSLHSSNVDWAWEGWVWVDSDQSGQYEFFYANDASHQISWSGNEIQCWFNDENSTSNHNVTLQSGDDTAPTDMWHYVVISRISNVWKLYLNGVEKDSVTDTFTAATPSLVPTMGAYSSGSYRLNGRMSQVRIHKGTGLTAAEITRRYEDAIGDLNLKFHLDANNSASYGGTGTTWYDLTTNNHDGTIDGATFKASDLGSSVFDFDGTDDHVEFPDSDDWHIDEEDDYTILTWFNTHSHPNSWSGICGQWKNSNNNATNCWLVEYVFSGGNLYFYYVTSSGVVLNKTVANALSDNTWHCFALTKQGDTTKIFIDNTQVVDDFDLGPLQNGNGVFTVGGDIAGNGYYDGQVASVKVYRTALSTDQLTRHYNETKDVVGLRINLDGDFSDSYNGSGVTWYDLTSQDNDATITGATWDSSNKWFELDGTDDRFNITSGSHAPGTGDFAITCWVRFSEDTNGFVWDTRSATNEDDGLIFFYYGGSDDSWRVWTNSSSQIASSADAVSLNTWYHAVVTRISGTTTLYINGTSIGSFSDSFNYTHDDIVIGNNVTNATYWEGDIGSFRAYKGVGLSAADATAQYNAQKSKFGY